MSEPARIIRLHIPPERRIVCISDIHGHLDLLTKLLAQIRFCDADMLLLLGDFYTKGPQGRETLRYVMALCEQANVRAIRGNSDWLTDDLTAAERDWIERLPHIIETDRYVFVHGGLTSGDLREQEAGACMKNDAFLEQGISFDRYVITGHWPTTLYCHRVPCNNPIIDHEKRIISIDGGTFKKGGQLNAFLIQNGQFSFEAADALPTCRAEKSQPESGGTLHITWIDRFVELVENGEEFGIYRHLQTGKTLEIPNDVIWTDESGPLCAVDLATDYHLPVTAGEFISVVRRYSDRLYAKKDGVMGWVTL